MDVPSFPAAPASAGGQPRGGRIGIWAGAGDNAGAAGDACAERRGHQLRRQGPGSLRDALEAAADGDSVDLTQLTCSRISLTTGAIVFGANSVAITGPGRNELTIDGGLSGAVLYHLGFGTLVVSDLSIAYGFKYRSDAQVSGSCVHSGGNALLLDVNISTCNTVSTGSYSALGGAVYAAGIVELEHSTVTMSEAKANGTGYASGGGVYGVGGVVSVYSTISNNVALVETTRKGRATRGMDRFSHGARSVRNENY